LKTRETIRESYRPTLNQRSSLQSSSAESFWWGLQTSVTGDTSFE